MKKTVFMLVVVAMVFSLSGVCFAGTIQKDSLVCATEELLNEYISAAGNNDIKGGEYLLSHGCFHMKKNFQVSVLDTNWKGIAKVRIYSGDGDAVVGWTSIKLIH